jgi:hypothetical protein
MTGTPSRTATAASRDVVEGRCKQSSGPRYTNRIRGAREGARGHKDLKPNVIRTERAYMRRVDGVIVTRLTLGELHRCRWASRIVRCGDVDAAVSRGRSNRDARR